MFCYKCGCQLPDNGAFCQQCGARQPQASSPTQTTPPTWQPQAPTSFGPRSTPSADMMRTWRYVACGAAVLLAVITVALIAPMFGDKYYHRSDVIAPLLLSASGFAAALFAFVRGRGVAMEKVERIVKTVACVSLLANAAMLIETLIAVILAPLQ